MSISIYLAESVGFEPTEVLPSPVFETSALGRTMRRFQTMQYEVGREGLEPSTDEL